MRPAPSVTAAAPAAEEDAAAAEPVDDADADADPDGAADELPELESLPLIWFSLVHSAWKPCV